MKKILVAICLFAAAFSAARAQDLNPTVEVTRSYKGRTDMLVKPASKMAVPDSLMKFDLDFDYSVFDTPFKGGFEFNPYLLDFKPEASSDGSHRAFLSGSFGWPVGTEFDGVWEPLASDRARLAVYAVHRSDYRNYAGFSDAPAWKGYDIFNRAGAHGRYFLDGVTLGFQAGWTGVNTEDAWARSNYNSLNVMISADSFAKGGSGLRYAAALGWRYGQDDFRNDGWAAASAETGSGFNSVYTHDFTLRGKAGQVIDTYNSILVDFTADISHTGGVFGSSTGLLSVTPHYSFVRAGWNISAGARLSAAYTSGDKFLGHRLNPSNTQVLYPDVRASYEVVPGKFEVYGAFAGSDEYGNLYGLKMKHHFAGPLSGRGMGPYCDNMSRRFDARIGARGHALSHLRYSVDAGFSPVKDGLVWSALRFDDGAGGQVLVPAVSYVDFSQLDAGFSATWDSSPLGASAYLRFTHSDITSVCSHGFEDAPLRGGVAVQYDWKGRLSAGVSMDFATARRGYVAYADASSEPEAARISGWMNLGLEAEYAFTRRMSFKAALGNILMNNIQIVPLYGDDNLTFRAGLTVLL